MAWSDEVAAMYGLQHGVAVLAWQNADGKKSTYPKPPEPPPLAHEVEARQKRDLARAQKHLARRRARNQARDPEVTTTDT